MKPISRIAPRLALASVTLALGACSTPDAALQQANHTAGLMAAMQRELITFQRVQAVSEQSRQESLHEQRQALATARLLSGPRIRSRLSAGDSATQELANRMVADAEALAADEAEAAGTLAANQAAVAKLMTPLPSTGSAIAKAQSKMAVMGEELSRGTRVAELRAVAKAVQDSVEANRKKIEEAEAAAATTQ